MMPPSLTRKIAFRAFTVWLLIVPAAFLNGLLRETVLLPFLGPCIALPASGALLASFILWLTWRSIPFLGLLNARQYLYIGAGWLGLSILFESGLGLALGKSLTELLRDYDIRSGNLWCVVLAALAASPWVVAKLQERI